MRKSVGVISHVLTLALLVLGVSAQQGADPVGAADNESKLEASESGAKAPKLNAEAKARLKETLEKVRENGGLDMDWQAIDASKAPDEKAGLEVKLKFKKKLLDLLEFCNEERFQTLSAVDELDFLSASDKQVCKDRLKLINPFIE